MLTIAKFCPAIMPVRATRVPIGNVPMSEPTTRPRRISRGVRGSRARRVGSSDSSTPPTSRGPNTHTAKMRVQVTTMFPVAPADVAPPVADCSIERERRNEVKIEPASEAMRNPIEPAAFHREVNIEFRRSASFKLTSKRAVPMLLSDRCSRAIRNKALIRRRSVLRDAMSYIG